MSDENRVVPVVIIEKEEYDRLVSAAISVPVMEKLQRFRAADTTWAVHSVERRETVAEWSEIVITGRRPVYGFRDMSGGSDWNDPKP